MGCCVAKTHVQVQADDDDSKYIVAVIGPPCSGKTALVRRILQNEAVTTYRADTAVDVGMKVLQVNDLPVMSVELVVYPGAPAIELEDADITTADSLILVGRADVEDPFTPLEAYLSKFQGLLNHSTGGRSLVTSFILTHADVVVDQPSWYAEVVARAEAWASAHDIAHTALVSPISDQGVRTALKRHLMMLHAVRHYRPGEPQTP